MPRLVLKRCLPQNCTGHGRSRKRQRFGPATGEATVDKLMELVGRGDTHISTAAELARTIQSDFGTTSAGIRDLASCGADGKHDSNTERDFWTWTKGAYKFHVEPYQIKLTLHVDSNEDPLECTASVLLPHEIFGALYDRDKRQFHGMMCGHNDGASILRFWNHVKTLSEYKHHPVLHSLSDEELKCLIPCCVHGDGAEMYRDDEFFIMNWSSVFGAGGNQDCLVSRYPISITAERQMKSDAVRDGVNKTIAELVAWSLHHASVGRYPEVGFYGEQFEKNTYRDKLKGKTIAGNYKLCWFGFKADLKARYQCHLLAEKYQCKKMCDRCEAIQPTTSAAHPMTYKNFSNDAPYRSTGKDHEAYLRTAKRVTPWAQAEGFQFEHISYDVMHLIFLGVARSHVPSALKLLKVLGYHYEGGESEEKFLQRASMEMKQDCKEHKLYLPRRLLSVSNTGSFGRDDYCELSSRFKAQHIKTMVWWIAKKVMEITQGSEDPLVLHLQLCCWSLARAIEIMDCSGLVMSTDEATDFSKMLHLHLKSTQILAGCCWRRRLMCFKLRPKHHCLWHVAEDVASNQLNPRIFHVWGDEKWLGRVKRIAVKCHGSTVQKRAMERYILSLSHYLHSYGDS